MGSEDALLALEDAIQAGMQFAAYHTGEDEGEAHPAQTYLGNCDANKMVKADTLWSTRQWPHGCLQMCSLMQVTLMGATCIHVVEVCRAASFNIRSAVCNPGVPPPGCCIVLPTQERTWCCLTILPAGYLVEGQPACGVLCRPQRGCC